MLRSMLAAVLLLSLGAPAVAEDRIFHHDNGALTRFDGRPMWMGAAICAAFADTYDRQIQLNHEEYAEKRSHWPPVLLNDPKFNYDVARDEITRNQAQRARPGWVEFGLMRLNRDRPGQPGAEIFEQQVTLERPAVEAALNSTSDVDDFQHSCNQFARAIQWNKIRMQRGWPDQTDGGN